MKLSLVKRCPSPSRLSAVLVAAGLASLGLSACSAPAGEVGHSTSADSTGDAGIASPVSVQFVSPTPADESTVSGLVTFQVEASTTASGAQIAAVDFSGYFIATRPPFQFTVDTTQLLPGGNGYGFTAIAWDTAGNASPPVGVAFNVANAPSPAGTPPSVWLATPAANAPTSGTVSFTVASSPGDAPIAQVNYYLAGAYADPNGAGVPPCVLVGTSATPPYSFAWDSTVGQNGFYALTAVAIDANGLQAATPPSVFYVQQPSTPPSGVSVLTSVQIAAPQAGAAVSGSFALALDVEGTTDTPAMVYVDGADIAAFSGAPYQVTLDTTQWSNGPHTLGASLSDGSGNVAESSLVTITVQN